ncbi:MAG: SEC-C domain-containing protein, partial [Gaiellales bacterium]
FCMSTVSISRNALCRCGSGQKYKRCCQALDETIIRDAAACDQVASRIQTWSTGQFADEIEVALTRYLGPQRVLGDDDLALFALWFHNDRELAGGGTPAERYAGRDDLPSVERELASRIAGARLGLYRVLSTEPGRSLLLEGVVDGACVEVASQLVSRDAIRWDVLLAHVMDGDPPTLWGPVRFFQPCDEHELVAELERCRGATVDQLDGAALASAYRRHAFELLRYTTERAKAERSFFTLEGDPVTLGSAAWLLPDLPAATVRLRQLGQLSADEAPEIDITRSRAVLVAQRPLLPPGALIIESGPVDAIDSVPIASLRIEDGRLYAEAISEPRLDHAIEIVTADFGGLVELVSRDLQSVDDAIEQHEPTGRRAWPGPGHAPDVDERQLIERLVQVHAREWLDEPHAALGGRTPRDAHAAGQRAEVDRLLRQLENSAERARRRGEPAADTVALRRELDLGVAS